MNVRMRSCSTHRRELLAADWELALARSEPGGARPLGDLKWLPAPVPGTVAAALRASGEWSFEDPPRRFDAEQWLYRRRFDRPEISSGERVILGLDGLATLAEISLNGVVLGRSDNMFVAREYDITEQLRPCNELLLRFASLETFLSVKRPRPRWRAPMVAHPQLRWVRTTLLGRTPGWSAPAPPVGPWRPVWIERRSVLDIRKLRVLSAVEGRRGFLNVEVTAAPLGTNRVTAATASVSRGEGRYSIGLQVVPPQDSADGAVTLQGRLEIPDVELWWPHTHGQPSLYDAQLRISTLAADGTANDIDIDLGRVGFRTVSLERGAGDFALRINGQRVFCRGAIWTPLDCVSLSSPHSDYVAALAQARAAGMNMLRVAGPFVYESDDFLDLCDANGILLWQDFMFANMDYPCTDAAFLHSVRTEVTQVLQRLQAHPALAVVCGNSEVYQQAAMSAAPRDLWSAPFFEQALAELTQRHCPDVAYCPSSAHGGDPPFCANQGVTSYYGVGAYLRPLEDARRSQLRFASECLAFANVPEHQQRWKERTPRDLGAGWDFDDVRDHYLEEVLRLDARTLRYTDQDRYLRCSRVVTGEVMAAAFAEWRRARSSCNGALILFLRDLWPGAGWGLIDSVGLPKAPYYYLKRTLQSTALLISDEGPNGLRLHLVNEGAQPMCGQVQIQLYRSRHPVGRPVSRAVRVDAHAALELNALELFEGFVDLSYYYRFGPCSYEVLHAAFSPGPTASGPPLEAFYFPTGLPNTQLDVGLKAVARHAGAAIQVDIESRDFAQSVHISAPGYVADDQYFHLAPGGRRTVRLTPQAQQPAEDFAATVQALNCPLVCSVGLDP